MVKNEDPQAVAQYVMSNDLGKISNGQHRRWARAFLRSLKRTIRRMKRVAFQELTASSYDPNPSKKASSRRAKRQCRKAQAKEAVLKPPKGKRTFKYGLEVPKSWKDIIRKDTAAENTRWQQAVEKEVGALIQHQCFDFKSADYKPSADYQYCRLHLVYDIKPDLMFKARLVCDRSRIDPRGLSTRATVI